MPECRSCKQPLRWKKPYDKSKPFHENVLGMNGKPHNCKNKKFGDKKSSRYYRSSYDYDPFNGDRNAETRYKEKLEKATFYCDICKTKVRFVEPCDHHLPDAYKYKTRKAIISKRIKEGNVK